VRTLVDDEEGGGGVLKSEDDEPGIGVKRWFLYWGLDE